MKKMIVIDGNSLLFRAFYATSFPGAPIMQTKDGQPTNAIFAFSNMILKIINDQKEEFNLCVAFDTGKKTFRHSELETYKANRKPVPTELVSQMPLARELLKNMGVFIYEQEGVEGDDIAGTVAKKAKEEGYDVTIYTSDRDFLQLIEDNITIYILKKGLSDIAIMNHDAMVEKYGFEPIQIQDYKGLMGDPSDNLPGIPGVGEKTAIKLIQEYQSLENIIEAAKTMTSKLGQKIIENQELGKLCKHLAIIKTDVELPFTINDTLYKGFHFDELREFCIKYELKQLLAKIKPAKSNTNEIKNEEIRYTIIENTNDIDFDKLIKATNGYSGADISNVCREASLMPMRRNLIENKGRNIEELVNDPDFRRKIEAPIGMKDLNEAIGNISKSVSQKDLEVYDKWTAEFSSV